MSQRDSNPLTIDTNVSSIHKPSIPSPAAEPTEYYTARETQEGDYRNLILAFDGTADFFDGDISNVARFIRYIKKDDYRNQRFYYQPGIGTYVDPTTMRATTLRKASRAIDLAVAWFLDGHIMEGYKYVMQNYRQGDRISLFGFSRGAYTARCLAGMIHKIGLLPKDNHEQIHFAWKCYVDTSLEGEKQAAKFKETFCADVRIDFVGVWDTVSSVGVFLARHLPFTSSNVGVRCFRQALALDEHRARFKPNVWHRPSPNAEGARYDPECSSKPTGNVLSRLIQVIQDPNGQITVPVGASVDDSGREPENVKMWPDTDVKEVWFTGVHADVGGGSVDNCVKHSLANNSLRWMIKEVLEQTTIALNEEKLKEIGVQRVIRRPAQSSTCLLGGGNLQSGIDSGNTPPDSGKFASRLVDSPVDISPDKQQPYRVRMARATRFKKAPQGGDGSRIEGVELVDHEEPHNHRKVDLVVSRDFLIADAMAPVYDQLKSSPSWWLLELIPMYLPYQDEDGNWHRKWRFNLGGPRAIRDPNPLFHSSVRLRAECMAEQVRESAQQQQEEQKKRWWWNRKPKPITGYDPKALCTVPVKFID